MMKSSSSSGTLVVRAKFEPEDSEKQTKRQRPETKTGEK